MDKPSVVGWVMTLLFIAAICYITIWKDFKENKFKKKITNEALNGNEYALRILKKRIWIDFKDREIILEALKGNEAALKILNIEEKQNERINY